MNQPWIYMCSPSRSPPHLPLHWSLYVFPVHQVRARVSCIQPGLVICFTLDSIHVSMLFSLNIPPSPSPTESQSLFCTSVSLCLFCMEVLVLCAVINILKLRVQWIWRWVWSRAWVWEGEGREGVRAVRRLHRALCRHAGDLNQAAVKEAERWLDSGYILRYLCRTWWWTGLG